MRDYDKEHQDGSRKYAYEFDSVLRRYMMRALEPFVRDGRTLELGCYKGEVTEVLARRFSDLTVVEASGELLAMARQRVGNRVRFIHSTFETADLPDRYDSIFLVHTLEHIDDPVLILRRVDSWLSPS